MRCAACRPRWRIRPEIFPSAENGSPKGVAKTAVPSSQRVSRRLLIHGRSPPYRRQHRQTKFASFRPRPRVTLIRNRDGILKRRMLLFTRGSIQWSPGPDAVSGPQARDNLRVWGSPRSAMPEFVMARIIARVLAVVFGFSFGCGILRRVASRRRSVKREVVKPSP